MKRHIKLCEDDYVRINTETGEPVEGLDIIYHISTILSEDMELALNEKFISMGDLPKALKDRYIKALERNGG